MRLTYLRFHILEVCLPLIPDLEWAMQSLKKTSCKVVKDTFSLDVIKSMFLSMKLRKIKIFMLFSIVKIVTVLLY
jgi:hypothetical protein